MSNPYAHLPDRAFWRRAVSQIRPAAIEDLHHPKFPLDADSRLVTAGSCFAQRLTQALRDAGMQVLDCEPGPAGVSEKLARQYGFGIYSARWGNIYSARQMVQLLDEVAAGDAPDARHVWECEGRWYDALRPGVEPNGLDSMEDVLLARTQHLARIGPMLAKASHFVFTLGLTETWQCLDTGRVYPSAPGVIAGEFDADRHGFVNLTYPQIFEDLTRMRLLLQHFNPEARLILSVSPVAMIATAAGRHVLAATSHTKSVLRAAAGEFADAHPDVDYFPAYELITNPAARGVFYQREYRDVSPAGVAAVLAAFRTAYGLEGAAAHQIADGQPDDPAQTAQDEGDLICEEILNEVRSE